MSMQGFLKKDTAVNVTILMVDSSDHVTGKTGLTLTIYATKAAGTPASISPSVTELDSTNVKGIYKLALTSSHTDTLGELQLHITASGADPTDVKWQVSTYLPGEAATLQADQAVNVTKVNGTSQTAGDLAALINTVAGYVDTEVAAIKAKTDNLPASPAATGDIPSAAAVASQVRTELATELAHIDADVSSRLATAGYTAPDNADIAAIKAKTDELNFTTPNKVDATIEGGGSGGATAEEIWEYDNRSLTQTAAQVADVMDGSDLTLTNRVGFAATLTGLTIPSTWTKVILTVKSSTRYDDAAAILQLAVSNPADVDEDGITVLLSGDPSEAQRTYGSLVVDQDAGTVAIAIMDDLDFPSAYHNRYGYDLKVIRSDGESALLAGSADFTIAATETKAIA